MLLPKVHTSPVPRDRRPCAPRAQAWSSSP